MQEPGRHGCRVIEVDNRWVIFLGGRTGMKSGKKLDGCAKTMIESGFTVRDSYDIAASSAYSGCHSSRSHDWLMFADDSKCCEIGLENAPRRPRRASMPFLMRRMFQGIRGLRWSGYQCSGRCDRCPAAWAVRPIACTPARLT